MLTPPTNLPVIIHQILSEKQGKALRNLPIKDVFCISQNFFQLCRLREVIPVHFSDDSPFILQLQKQGAKGFKIEISFLPEAGRAFLPYGRSNVYDRACSPSPWLYPLWKTQTSHIASRPAQTRSGCPGPPASPVKKDGTLPLCCRTFSWAGETPRPSPKSDSSPNRSQYSASESLPCPWGCP